MELKGIKGITTFIQNTEPTNPSRGDVWVKPGHVSKKVYSRDKWNRSAWLDMVSGAVYGPGSDYGYSLGGYDWGSHTSIDRITFPFDSGTATHVGNVSSSRRYNAGCNSSNYGYSLGGDDDLNHTIIDRITFPFDSGTATHVGNMSSSRRYNAGCNSSNYGYSLGADDNGNRTSIDRITFPFDSGTATHVGNMSNTRYSNAACDGTDFVTLFVD